MKKNNLDNIEEDKRTNDSRLQEVITQWLRAVITHKPSWEKLVKALLAVGEEELAVNIEKKYITPHRAGAPVMAAAQRVGAPVMAATQQDDPLGMSIPI